MKRGLVVISALGAIRPLRLERRWVPSLEEKWRGGLQQVIEKGKDVVQRMPPVTAEFFKPVPPAVDPADVILLAQELQTCLKCGGELRVSNDDVREWVCMNPGCGRVWGSEPDGDRIPFEDSSAETGHNEGSYSPTGHLDWGKSLGSKVDSFLAADVLGDSGEIPEELLLKLEDAGLINKLAMEELGIGKPVIVKNGKFRNPLSLKRASHLQVPLTYDLLQKLLTVGSELCERFELHKKGNIAHAQFADQLGINLGRIGKHYVKENRMPPHSPDVVARAVFCSMYRELYPDKFERAQEAFAKHVKGQMGDAEFDGLRVHDLCLPEAIVTYYELVLKSLKPDVLPTLEP